ncbi:MAG: DUF302 domain-containing protein [Pseudomonadota bacterium]
MKKLLSIVALAVGLGTGGAAMAETGMQHVAAEGSVAEVADRLSAIVEEAGARVMARIDHGAGAVSVDSDIGGSELVIFGNPQVGTPVMEQDRLAGFFLPLRVLVYEDEDGAVWLAYQEPSEMLAPLGDVAESEAAGRLGGALARFTEAAATE